MLNWIQEQFTLLFKAIAAFYVSIGAKIILPYLLLTLAVAGVGAFIVTSLVTESLQERFHNQLLDAGRVVAETIVRQETERLATLRAVVTTAGVAESVAAGDSAGAAALLPQLLANSQMDGATLLTANGRHLYSWQRRSDGLETWQPGPDLAEQPETRAVLNGVVDELGDKYVLLYNTPGGLMLYTVGPIYLGDELVGAALVGSLVRPMVIELTETAVARVTLYDQHGQVIDTTLGLGGAANLIQTPDEIVQITAILRESSDRYQIIVTGDNDTTPLSRVEFLGQEYWLAFGEWRLRNQSFGLFSVALPGNFIVNAAVTSRRLLSAVFALSTMGVFLIGFTIAQRIVQPLNQLVQTSLAVAQGDLKQRSGISSRDEIGRLAASFDEMTQRLAERNQELLEQASKLEAILSSIADGVLVLNNQQDIVSFNPAAKALLNDLSVAATAAPIKALLNPLEEQLPDGVETADDLRRFRIGGRILSALAAPVKTPEGDVTGTVIVLRDITREVENEELKEGFITSISHELRTPLTAIIGYSHLLLMSAGKELNESQQQQLQRVADNANELNRHINALIDISQIQAQSLTLKRDPLSLSKLLRELATRWAEPMAAKKLAFTFDPPAEDVWVQGDAHYLGWAIENLLSNAHNYTLEGGRVDLRLWVEGDEARLEVKDSGVGVSAADLPHLFDRFFRAANELTFEARGVGLGLYVSRSIVEMHDGRISVNSALGQGSLFSLALPLIGETS